ncbi:MAG: glycerophosphodiester phosphodiesterase [Acidimicrobiales bacterium]|nr:glycerophosphodiester phosphodiesterase [Acidimicrobiales bacterium]
MIGPDPNRFPFLDFDGIIAFAHRGGTDVAPENTIAAFDHAVSLGYRYLETDVHRTADGTLVAFHDSGLQRFTGTPRAVADCTWEELQTIRLDHETSDGKVSQHMIPTLAELFDRYPNARFNIDPKADDAVDLLAETITSHGAIDRVCIGAFSDARIGRIKSLLGPAICTSPGPRAVLAAIAPWPLPGNHPCVSIPTTFGSIKLNHRLVRRFHRQGYRIHVWTVNDAVEMHRMIDLGVDGIMTDNCTLLKSVLVERGLWR